MSLHIAKLIRSPLALVSAAFIVHIGAATAADSPGGIQQQMKELLTGTIPTHFVSRSEPGGDKVTSPAADSQEYVKQLLLGATASRVGGTEAIKHSEVVGASGKTDPKQRPVTHRDMQAAVRQDLLGQHHVSDAS